MSKHNEHYSQGQYQPWDFCEDLHLDALEFNIVKYVTRLGRKDDAAKDFDKAIAYCTKADAERQPQDKLEAFTESQNLPRWQADIIELVLARHYKDAAVRLKEAYAEYNQYAKSQDEAHQLDLAL